VTGTEHAARTRRIAELIDGLLARIAGVPEEALHRAAPDGWSAGHVLAHVVEFVPYWARQAEAVAARDRDGLPFGRTSDDAERTSAIERRWRDAGGRLAQDLASSRDDCVATLERIPPAGWRRSGLHARRGAMSVADIVDLFLVEHLAEHETQAVRALAAPGEPDRR
jgi:hypothetical protein